MFVCQRREKAEKRTCAFAACARSLTHWKMAAAGILQLHTPPRVNPYASYEHRLQDFATFAFGPLVRKFFEIWQNILGLRSGLALGWKACWSQVHYFCFPSCLPMGNNKLLFEWDIQAHPQILLFELFEFVWLYFLRLPLLVCPPFAQSSTLSILYFIFNSPMCITSTRSSVPRQFCVWANTTERSIVQQFFNYICNLLIRTTFSS